VSDITDAVFCFIMISFAGRFETCPYNHENDWLLGKCLL